tara:strand:- start:209 stop:445 length:237 start_codon:yes stop_codon:yes gene_type:complete
MFGNLMSGLINTEQITYDTIQEALENLSQELQCQHTDFFIMIKPMDAECNMKFYVYKLETGVPKFVREITLKEILNTQ